MDYILYDENLEAPQLHSVVLQDNEDPQVIEIAGRTTQNTLVLPNAGDHAYIISSLSAKFIEKLKAGNLKKIPDPNNRMVVFRS